MSMIETIISRIERTRVNLSKREVREAASA